VPEILRVAIVALVELVSSGELLRVALVELELERVFQEDAEGANLEEERRGRGGHGGRAGPRQAPSSAPSMANGGEDGGEDNPKTNFLKSKIKG
jgi:hypothetical protein